MACSYSCAVLKYPWGSPFWWYLFTVYSIFMPWMSLLKRGCIFFHTSKIMGWSLSRTKKWAWRGWMMMWIMLFFFCHLVAHFTSAWMHLLSNICTYSIAKTTTMHDKSFLCHFLANRRWVIYHFNIISNNNNNNSFCPVISHPPMTLNEMQSHTVVSSASLRLCVHDSEKTAVMIHSNSPEGIKNNLLREDVGAHGIFQI